MLIICPMAKEIAGERVPKVMDCVTKRMVSSSHRC